MGMFTVKYKYLEGKRDCVMKVPICPLCDQPMKKAHRCDSCNSFVWKPLYLDIHYNTETMQGDDCSYDIKDHDYRYREDGSVTMMPSDDEARTERPKFRGVKEIKFPEDDSRRSVKRRSAETGTKKKGGCLKTLILIVSISVIILSIVDILSAVVFDLSADRIPEPDIASLAEGTAEWLDSDSNRVELTDEEVWDAGEECNGYGHMSRNVQDVLTQIESALMDLLDTDEVSYYDESSNYAYDYGNGYIMNTYYSTERMYYLDEITGSYCVVSWDTYSGNLHEICFDMYDSAAAEMMYVSMMRILTQADGQFAEEFQKQRSVAEEEGYVFFVTETYEVYISYYEGGNGYDASYFISIVQAM